MKRFYCIITLLVLLVLTLAGCASTPTTTQQSTPATPTSTAYSAAAAAAATVEAQNNTGDNNNPYTAPPPTLNEKAFKASTTNTTVSALDKNGSSWTGKAVHFTAIITGFVKDSSGITRGANVHDSGSSFSSSSVQIGFPAGTDINRLNQDDTIQVWGTDGGTASGKNAFGATVQEVVVSAYFLTDITTGYQDNG